MKRAADGCLLAETANQLGVDLHKLLVVDLNPYRMRHKSKYVNTTGTLTPSNEKLHTATLDRCFQMTKYR